MAAKGYIDKDKFNEEIQKTLHQIEKLNSQILEEKKKERDVLPLGKNEPIDNAINRY